jgi:hypothetical protein
MTGLVANNPSFLSLFTLSVCNPSLPRGLLHPGVRIDPTPALLSFIARALLSCRTVVYRAVIAQSV